MKRTRIIIQQPPLCRYYCITSLSPVSPNPPYLLILLAPSSPCVISNFCFHFPSFLFPSHPYSLFLPAFGNSKTNSNNSTNSDIRSRTNARFPARSRSSRCCIYHADSPFLIFTKIVAVVFTFNIRHANSLLLIFFKIIAIVSTFYISCAKNYPSQNHHG